MKNRIAALLAVLALTASLTACGGNAAAPASSSTTVDKTEEQQTSAPGVEASAPAEEQEASAAEPASDVQEVPEPVVYELPLTDTPTTFTVYTTAAPGFMSPYLGPDGSYNSAESTKNFAELTGVTLQFIEIDMMSFSQNFNLMIASGDYPDLISGVDGYAGGYTKAMDDGVIIDLTDYVENDMPAYCQRLDEADAWKDVMNDEGQMLAIYSLNSETIVDRGPVVRKDWMNALNLEEPTDYDGWTEMGKALMNGYNLPYAFYFSNVINPSITLSAGFDLPGLDMSASGTHFYQKDGQVESALVSDNFKDFLSLLHEWYALGLISKDFFTQQSMDVKNVFAGDGCGVCWDNADFITEDNTNAELAAKGFYCTALPIPTREEGQTLHYSLNMDGAVQAGLCVSTACEDPELLVKTMDFSFTDQGALLSNYGIDGISYEMNAEGKPRWTEAMTNVEGQTFRATILTYILNGLPTYVDVKKYWSETFDEDSLYAVELWSDTPTDKAYALPSALFFTSEESSVYATKITDVETYANEYILTCITGDADIDATWDDYAEKVWSLGLQDCIDATQNAYERYLSRSEA